MNGALGHNAALGATLAKEMNFIMNHAPSAGLIA